MVEIPQGIEAFQSPMFRLETRARELAVMASLTFNRGKTKGNRIRAAYMRGDGFERVLVIAVRLETGRSIPG
jgi:hypothetical protein